MTEYLSLPDDLPIPEDDGAADHLTGRAVPDLELQATNGDTIGLNALRGRAVLYLYPRTARPGVAQLAGWDQIPGARGCTPESCAFRDHHAELLEAGAGNVFGLSSQDTEYQREAVERLHLPFPLLADPNHELGAALGLPTFEAGGLTLYKRLTMILRDDAVEHVFYPVFPPDGHAGEVLEWLREN